MTTVEAPYDAEVEYLESTGTQWIDTGIYTQNNIASFDVLIRSRYTQVPGSGYKGSLYTTGMNPQFFYALNSNSATGLYMAFNGKTDIAKNLSAEKTAWHDVRAFVQGENVVYIFDMVEVGRFTYQQLSLPGVNLFACAGNRGQVLPDSIGMQAIARFCLTIDGTLVRDMVPVRFTNELGQSEGAMYDKVSGQLFRNQGTGSFVVGPDVRPYSTPVMGLHFMREPVTARSYAQDGLVAMWDGIENAGWGVHDPNATTWKDLSGGMGDFSGVPRGKWNGNGLVFDGYTLHMSKQPNGFTAITMEFVVDSFSRVTTSGTNSGAFVGWPTQDGTGSNLSIGYWGHLNTSSAYSKVNRLDSGAIPKNTISGVFTSSGKSIYNDGVFMTSNTFGITLPRQGYQLSIMGYYNGYGTSLVFIGLAVVHSFRIYNRPLTAAEIAANYAIDRERFNLP